MKLPSRKLVREAFATICFMLAFVACMVAPQLLGVAGASGSPAVLSKDPSVVVWLSGDKTTALFRGSNGSIRLVELPMYSIRWDETRRVPVEIGKRYRPRVITTSRWTQHWTLYKV